MKYINCWLWWLALLLGGCREEIETPTFEIVGVKFLQHSSAVIDVNMLYDGGEHPTIQGVCWARHPEPTLSDSNVYRGDIGWLVPRFEVPIHDLQPDTEYYVRAYGENFAGVGYSRAFKFRTPDGNPFTDPRDGQSYPTARIGNQVWMAENLRYDAPGSRWYADDPVRFGGRFGKLYDWGTACKACPPGWRLPADADWREMGAALGGRDDLEGTGAYLHKIPGALRMPGRGVYWVEESWQLNVNNSTGFSALPVGGGDADKGSFGSFGWQAFFWSATEAGDLASNWRILDSRGLYRQGHPKGILLSSVRCIKE